MHISQFSFSMNSMYKYLEISRQAHYKAVKAKEAWAESEGYLLGVVKEVRRTNPGMGARYIFKTGKPIGIGTNKFERWVVEAGLGVAPKKKGWKTTDSKHHYHKYPNLTNGLVLTDVNQLWVTDITYYMVKTMMCYIVFIMDAYSRRVLGRMVSSTLLARKNLEALQESFWIRGQDKFENLIHHSDKGSQYCSNAYIDALIQAQCKISMAEDSLQNGYAERLNGVIKNQYLDYRPIYSLKSLTEYTNSSIEAYNTEKPHSGLLHGMAPIAFEIYIKTIKEKPAMILHDFKAQGLRGVLGGIGPNALCKKQKKP